MEYRTHHTIFKATLAYTCDSKSYKNDIQSWCHVIWELSLADLLFRHTSKLFLIERLTALLLDGRPSLFRGKHSFTHENFERFLTSVLIRHTSWFQTFLLSLAVSKLTEFSEELQFVSSLGVGSC